MNQAEKLDLILWHLYEFHKYKFYSLRYTFRNTQIDIASLKTIKSTCNRLIADQLIEIQEAEDDLLAKITAKGRLFCEQTSYAYPGFPIITHKKK